jgi:hypothetical protein
MTAGARGGAAETMTGHRLIVWYNTRGPICAGAFLDHFYRSSAFKKVDLFY